MFEQFKSNKVANDRTTKRAVDRESKRLNRDFIARQRILSESYGRVIHEQRQRLKSNDDTILADKATIQLLQTEIDALKMAVDQLTATVEADIARERLRAATFTAKRVVDQDE